MPLHRVFSQALISLVLSAPLQAHSLEIRPESEIDGVVRTLAPQHWWQKLLNTSAYHAIESFSHPEHERTVQLTWGCPRDTDCDADTSGYPFAPAAVVAGVRWNDNPPFELSQTTMSECAGRTLALPNYARCWFTLFFDGEKRAKNGTVLDLKSGSVIMLRSHFGDLQFLHAMASTTDERARETRDKILMWAEFTWRTALGEFGGGTRLSETNVPNLNTFFKSGETVQTLFTRGNPTHRKEIGNVAFGSLLHTLQDSFTRSHADRGESDGSACGEGLPQRPGRIRQFLNYVPQDSGKHKVEDKRTAVDLQLQTISPHMVDVGQYLKKRLEEKASWEDIRPYMACVFEVEDENQVTGAGNFAP